MTRVLGAARAEPRAARPQPAARTVVAARRWTPSRHLGRRCRRRSRRSPTSGCSPGWPTSTRPRASALLEDRALVRTLMMRRTDPPAHRRRLPGAGAGCTSRCSSSGCAACCAPGWSAVDEAELARRRVPALPRRAADARRGRPRAAGPVAGRRRADLGDALSSLVPLVQVPPRGLWRQNGPARNTTIAAWLGRRRCRRRPHRPTSWCCGTWPPSGPAASADVRAWSGLAGLPDGDRPARGRRCARSATSAVGCCCDLPDGPLPDPDTPAPPRFLPAFDNAVLGYDDRPGSSTRAPRAERGRSARFRWSTGEWPRLDRATRAADCHWRPDRCAPQADCRAGPATGRRAAGRLAARAASAATTGPPRSPPTARTGSWRSSSRTRRSAASALG